MLWERFKSSFKNLLDLHNQIVREVIQKHDGYEVKTENDAFMVAFNHAKDAVNFCLNTQIALHEAPWPEELLKPEELKDIAGVSDDGLFFVVYGFVWVFTPVNPAASGIRSQDAWTTLEPW